MEKETRNVGNKQAEKQSAENSMNNRCRRWLDRRAAEVINKCIDNGEKQ